jgi:hypothetical protein
VMSVKVDMWGYGILYLVLNSASLESAITYVSFGKYVEVDPCGLKLRFRTGHDQLWLPVASYYYALRY